MTLLSSVQEKSCQLFDAKNSNTGSVCGDPIVASGLTVIRAPFKAALLQIGKSGAAYDLVQAQLQSEMPERDLVEALQGLEKLGKVGVVLPTNASTGLQISRLLMPDIAATKKTFAATTLQDGSSVFIRAGRTAGVTDPIGAGPPALVTGLCLFGSSGLRAVDEAGALLSLSDPSTRITTPISRVEADAQLSSYEIESLIRQSQCVRLAAKGLAASPQVFVHIPCEEYMLYATRARIEGKMSERQYAQLCGLVTERSERLMALMRERLPEFELSFLRPLAGVRKLIEQPPDDMSERELLEALRAGLRGTTEAERIFGELFKANGDELQSINYRGYVMGYLEAALSVPSRTVLAIETTYEERIMTVLDDKRTGLVKETKARGLCFRSLYRFDSLACLGEAEEVTLRVVPPPAVRGMLPPMLPCTAISARLPVMRPLFFANRPAAPGLAAALESTRSSL